MTEGPKCLSHDALHVGCPAVVPITEQQGEDTSLLVIVTFSTSYPRSLSMSLQRFPNLALLPLHLLLLLVLRQLQALLGHGDQTLPIRPWAAAHRVLISGLHHVHYHLKALLLHALHKGRVGNLLFALTSDVTDDSGSPSCETYILREKSSHLQTGGGDIAARKGIAS